MVVIRLVIHTTKLRRKIYFQQLKTLHNSFRVNFNVYRPLQTKTQRIHPTSLVIKLSTQQQIANTGIPTLTEQQ